MIGSCLIDDKETYQLIDTNVIESALIDKCIELYLGVLSEREEIEARKTDNRIDYGIPPKYMFLREYDAVKKTEHFYKRTFAKAWIYKDGELVPKQEDLTSDEDMERSGMYYKRATGDFYWDIENKKAFVNMSYGPRYARGYSYDIRLEGNKIILENEDVLWVS